MLRYAGDPDFSPKTAERTDLVIVPLSFAELYLTSEADTSLDRP
jgi:hypothetical protein